MFHAFDIHFLLSKKTPTGEFKDIVHPINPETMEKIQNAILEAYNALETEEEATE